MNMNVKTLIAAVTLLTSAGAVFAGDVNPFVEHTPVVSTKTRAEVIAEMQQAAAKRGPMRTSDLVDYGNDVSTRTRDEVRNEAIQAVKSGRTGSDVGG
jgi:hypothetical protein